MLNIANHVYVDSDYRISGTHSNFTYRLNLPKDFAPDSVALLQATIPKSYYLVRAGSNTFSLTELGTTTTVTIPPGNYSMNSFRTVLAAMLNASTSHGWVYAVAQPATATAASTGKYTYTVTGNAGSQPTISFPTSSSIYLQLGFDYNSTNVFVASSLTSTNVVNFNSTIGMMIKSDIINGAASDGVHGSAVLQEIFNFNTSDFSNIGFQNSQVIFSAKRLKAGPLPEVAQFVITDTNDDTLDFNGGSVNFSLVFFKRDSYHEFALQDLKMRWIQDLVQPNAMTADLKLPEPQAAEQQKTEQPAGDAPAPAEPIGYKVVSRTINLIPM